MTLKELRELLVSRVGRWDDDLRVVVPTRNGGVPHGHMADVTQVNAGFDWTRHLLMLTTAEPLVTFRQFEAAPREAGRKRLDELKAAYKKSGFDYIQKVRESAWIDGFKEGVRAFTLAAGATLPDGDTVPVQRSLLESIVQVGATEGQKGLRQLLAQLGEAAGIRATGTGKKCHCGTWFVASPDGERECQDCSRE